MKNPATAVHLAAARYTLLGHIFGAHVERIGFVRTIAGAIPQYTCIPLLIVIHTTLTVAMYQWLIAPLLGTPRVRWADHVIVDRHRIGELTWFDKFNCMFCGYANGLVTMINTELDHAAGMSAPVPAWKQPLLALICLAYVPIYLLCEINFQVIYNLLVATPLGFHRVSISQAQAVLDDGKYAAVHGPLFRFWLVCFKNVFLRFSMALEQIESSWCPLNHFEKRKGVVYPDHHKRFFGPAELENMRDVLRTTGTVSPRIPKY